MRLLLAIDSQSATVKLDLDLTEAGIGGFAGGVAHVDPDHVLGSPFDVWGMVSWAVSGVFSDVAASPIVFTQGNDMKVYGEKISSVTKSFPYDNFRAIKRGLYSQFL